MREITESSTTMQPLFEAIVKYPAPPRSNVTYFQMLISNLDYSDYLGRIAYGRITSGRVHVGDPRCASPRMGGASGPASRRSSATGACEIEVKTASAGDIIGLTGFEDAFIGETITDSEERLPLAFVDIDPPPSRWASASTIPLAGREGKLLTARQIRERLVRETRTNVGIHSPIRKPPAHLLDQIAICIPRRLVSKWPAVSVGELDADISAGLAQRAARESGGR